MSIISSFSAKVGAAAVVAGFAALAGPAAAANCGGDYTVTRGDTLSGIANDFYGESGSYQIIYSANSAVIGPNPALISVGMKLAIPCLDNVQASRANNAAITQLSTTTALPAPNNRAIRFVVGTDWAPFTHHKAEQGGMATEIANLAMDVADGNPDYKIDFIKDWGAHLQPLISDHAYDFALVWFKPNCDVMDKLGEESQFRCNNLKFSDPIFEQPVGYFTRTSEPEYTDHSQLAGKTLCRPSGYSIFMMEEKDLSEPNITLARETIVADCFRGVMEGKYDAAVMAIDVANGAIAEIGGEGKIRNNDHLSQITTLHAVTSYNHPEADRMLATLNSGIRKIKNNGEWFNIVQRHLAAHRAKNG